MNTIASSAASDETTLGLSGKVNGAMLSVEAFDRDLPDLLSTHRGKWVAYANGMQIQIGATQTELYLYCRALGFVDADFVIGYIAPNPGSEVAYTLR